MEEKAGAVFTWDPLSRSWIKERGEDGAALPPAPPIDDGAVQTYFFDPADAWWHTTILGPRARAIAASLKNDYRSSYAPGLAAVQSSRDPRPQVWQEKKSSGKSRAPLVIGGATLLVFIGGGALAAQAFFATPKGGEAADAIAKAVSSAVASTTATLANGATPAASITVDPTSPPTAAASGAAAATARPATRAPAPTPAPAATTLRLSGRTPSSGVAIFYSGPSVVQQNAYFDAVFTAVLANGTPSGVTMNVRLGSGAVVNAKTDGSGTYTAQIPANVAKGSQPLTVFYGNNGEQVVLGSLTVQ